MNVNVRAAALLVKALVPHMNREGRIINVSSILARNPFPCVDIYTASKGALEALTRQWARTLGRSHGITTNAVSPGMILTDMTEGTDPSVLDLSKRSATAGERLGTPDDVAQVVAFLAGDGSRWINGDCIQVHGGVIFR
jgi:3-oxoacyl-[acyl-carrier protein] reductase